MANITTNPQQSKGDHRCTTDYMRHSGSNFGETEDIQNTMNSVMQSGEKNDPSKSIADTQSLLSKSNSKDRVKIKSLINVTNNTDSATKYSNNHIPKKQRNNNTTTAKHQQTKSSAKISHVVINAREAAP